jgi:predicted secreted protein
VNEPEISPKDNNSTILYSQNSQFSLSLVGNITTGYTWKISSIDSAKIVPLGTYEYKSSSQAIGSSGNFIFKFRTKEKGSTLLKLYYLKEWEKGIVPIDSFNVNINIY